MLRVTAARRLVATLLAPCLVLFLTMPEAVHRCAMHSVAGAAHVHGATATHHMAGHDVAMPHAGMSHGGMSHAASTAPSAPAGTPICSCPEGCCTVTVVSGEVPTTLSWVRELLTPHEPAYPRARVSVALSTAVQLPFANGPPTQG